MAQGDGFDWGTPLIHLKLAFEKLKLAPPVNGPRYFDAYVDVSTDLEALEQIIDDVTWEVMH